MCDRITSPCTQQSYHSIVWDIRIRDHHSTDLARDQLDNIYESKTKTMIHTKINERETIEKLSSRNVIYRHRVYKYGIDLNHWSGFEPLFDDVENFRMYRNHLIEFTN